MYYYAHHTYNRENVQCCSFIVYVQGAVKKTDIFPISQLFISSSKHCHEFISVLTPFFKIYSEVIAQFAKRRKNNMQTLNIVLRKMLPYKICN